MAKQGDILLEHIQFVADLFSRTHLRKEFLTTTVETLKNWTDCQCVGIRVIHPDGFMPYEAYQGFSQEFWEHENWLSVKDHECGCIRVATETPDPYDQAVLTEAGSIWTNDLQGFGETIPEERYPRYRGKCIEDGFATLAVVPIRHNAKVIGLIHLADMRRDMLPKETILALEAVAPMIGEVMARFSAEEAYHHERDFSAQLIDAMTDGFAVLDDAGVHIQVNNAFCDMTGFSQEELLGTGPPHPYWPEEEKEKIQGNLEAIHNGEIRPLTMKFMRKNGERFTALVNPARLQHGKEDHPYYFATIKDISELKMARRDLDEKVSQLRSALAKIKQLEGILPICMYCKKIRDDNQAWHQLEQYITDHSEAWFSHGICPDCADTVYKSIKIDKG